MIDRLASRPAELRDAFDRSFTRPPPSAPPPQVQLLVIATCGTRVAVRLDRLSGVHVNRRIVPLPGAPRELLGIAGVRGAVISVWDLALFLGLPRTGRRPRCRWIAECAGDERVALGFESLERQVEVPASTLQDREADTGFLKAVLRFESRTIGVLDVPKLLESLVVSNVTPRAESNAASNRSPPAAPEAGGDPAQEGR